LALAIQSHKSALDYKMDGYSIWVIHGILSTLEEGAVVEVLQLFDDGMYLDDVDSEKQQSLPPVQIQQLLQTYADVFESKVGYPPPSSCSHSIPLIPEERPVVVRPYRYAPVLKDEIEKQVQEMLRAGLIQQSTSPFSSPVLLVKKKDNTYHFCVDYRHLNAITEK
jgi:tRNA A37 N6-isopentenylltransferase MiaA